MQVIVGTLRCIRNCSVSFSIANEDVKREGFGCSKIRQKKLFFGILFQPYKRSLGTVLLLETVISKFNLILRLVYLSHAGLGLL